MATFLTLLLHCLSPFVFHFLVSYQEPLSPLTSLKPVPNKQP